MIYFTLGQAAYAPKFAEALGDMMLAWTVAERNMADCVAVILNTSVYNASRIYQKLPNYRSRTQAMYVLLELHPEFEPLRAPVAKLSSLSKTRNDWVHGTFLMSLDRKEIRSVDLDQCAESNQRSKPTKAADIINHSNAVRLRADELNNALRSVPAFEAWSEAQIAAAKTSVDPLNIRGEAAPPPPKNEREPR